MTCRTLWHYVAPPTSWSRTGRWVAYTAAQVAARRQARMVAVVVCSVAVGGVGYQAAQHAPAGWLGIPEPPPAIHAPVPLWRGMPPGPTWRATGEPVHAVSVPEPGTAVLLLGALWVMVWKRR